MSDERVTYDSRGHLDEIVTRGGAHLEHLGGKRWFLCCQRADGSEVCLWLTATITMMEEREAPKCQACGAAYGRDPAVTASGYLLCRACGWSPDPSFAEGAG